MELPSLVDLFQVGSLIPCVITDLESTKHGHKRIKLSADPKDVNKGIHPSAIREGMVRNQGGEGSWGENTYYCGPIPGGNSPCRKVGCSLENPKNTLKYLIFRFCYP